MEQDPINLGVVPDNRHKNEKEIMIHKNLETIINTKNLEVQIFESFLKAQLVRMSQES